MTARRAGATNNYACPIELTLDVMGRKWEPLILWELAAGPLNFNGLQTLLSGIAHKVLTQQLRHLERHDLIVRTVRKDGGRVRVDYALSDFGQTLRPVMRAMSDWAKRHHRRVGATLDPVPVRRGASVQMRTYP